MAASFRDTSLNSNRFSGIFRVLSTSSTNSDTSLQLNPTRNSRINAIKPNTGSCCDGSEADDLLSIDSSPAESEEKQKEMVHREKVLRDMEVDRVDHVLDSASVWDFNSFGRSIMSIRREQVHSMEGSGHDEVELFQKHVSERFQELSAAGSDEVLSISWIRRLLDTFLCCQEDFRMLLFNNKSQLSKAPADRVVAKFFERIVKALDVCNAIRDGVEQIKPMQNLVEIVLVALDGKKSLGEGQFRRAKKALIDLAIGMLDEKESAIACRNRSFGHQNNGDKSSHRSIDAAKGKIFVDVGFWGGLVPENALSSTKLEDLLDAGIFRPEVLYVSFRNQ